jgi:orotidine-5'-phosphate decarboxylase
MLDAAVSAGNGKVKVLGVTVLTSVLSEDLKNSGLKEAFCTDVSQLVLHRAETAKAVGCSGVVCSGLEVNMLRKKFGKDFVLVTPGIRPHWDVPENDDQQRITTPAQAIKNGADHIVVGRPIRDAKNPTAAAVRIVKEIEAALSK